MSITLHHVMRYGSAIVMAAALLILVSATADAQRFQSYFGGDSCREEGLRGTRQLANSGYIACGVSRTSGASCGSPHAYVIKADANGNLVWGNIYSIGAFDSATAIIEAANGDYVVCGITHPGPPSPPGSDIFVMRLDTNGNILTAITLDMGGFEDAWDLIETTTGTPGITYPGDIVVAGSTNAGFGPGAGRDAITVRFSAALGVIWESEWGGPTSNDDYLYSLDEATVGVPAFTAGDIVCVGGTTTPAAVLRGVGNGDALVLRLNGNFGTIVAPPEGAAAWGYDQIDEGFSIRELKAATTPGDLVLCGRTTSRPGTAINWEAFVLQLPADPTLPKIGDVVYGDNWIANEDALCVREDPYAVTPLTGGVIVSGSTIGGASSPPPTILGFQNAYLQRISASTMVLAGPAMAYGTWFHDRGWSVGICTRANANETPGYVLSGVVQNPLGPGARDTARLFLAKTNTALPPLSSCLENSFAFSVYGPLFTSATLTYPISLLPYPTATPTITTTAQSKYRRVCYKSTSTHDDGNGGNDGTSGVSQEENNDAAIAVWPNPAVAGTELKLHFELKTAARVTITVVDGTGREIYRDAGSYAAGTVEHALTTAGWPSGTYAATIAFGDRRIATRFVVTR